MQELRKTHRDRTYLGGRIIFQKQVCSIDCIVKNLTPDGAKIAVENADGIPSAFDLTIKDKGETRRAQVVWMSKTQAGVAFELTPRGNVISFGPALQARVDTQRLASRMTRFVDRTDPC